MICIQLLKKWSHLSGHGNPEGRMDTFCTEVLDREHQSSALCLWHRTDCCQDPLRGLQGNVNAAGHKPPRAPYAVPASQQPLATALSLSLFACCK